MSIAIESTNPVDVVAAVDVLGLRSYCNLHVLMGFGGCSSIVCWSDSR